MNLCFLNGTNIAQNYKGNCIVFPGLRGNVIQNKKKAKPAKEKHVSKRWLAYVGLSQ